ncbi:hypothetical protein ACPA9J_25725 [Pseudomonas aeruginosa]
MNWAADLNLPLMSEEERRRAVLGRRWRLRHAQPAHPARLREDPQGSRGGLRRARPGGARQRRRGAPAGRRGDLPEPGQAQYRDPGEIPLHPHRQLRPAASMC